MLVYHGKDPEVCEYVIRTFENNEFYKDHLTIKLWLNASRDVLNDIQEKE
jgi:hypothetical protein